jgi:hypothetical protein
MLTLEKYLAYEANTQKALDGGVNIKTGVPFDLEKVDANFDLIFEEHFKWQEIKSEAVLYNIISVEVGQLIYVALGNSLSATNGGWNKDVTTARKQAITQLMSELITQLIKARRNSIKV